MARDVVACNCLGGQVGHRPMARPTGTEYNNTSPIQEVTQRETIKLQDDWAHVMSRDEARGEDWVCEIHFENLPVPEMKYRRDITTDGNDEMEDLGP